MAQSLSLLGYLQTVIDLHRHHRHEIETYIAHVVPQRFNIAHVMLRCFFSIGSKIHQQGMGKRLIRKWMSAGLDGNKLKMTLDAPHHHHLAGDIVERHTEQGGVAWLQTQEIASDASGVEHFLFLHHHRLRLAGRATGMNQKAIATIIPFV